MAESEHKTCAHAACDCASREKNGFCSDHCKKAGETVDCECGHAECSGQGTKPQI
jgi:hypothetical protein